MDSRFHRLSGITIAGDAQPLETYQYLGVSRVVDENRPQEQADLS